MARTKKGCRCPKHLYAPVAGRISREFNWEVMSYRSGYPLGSGGESVGLPSSAVTCHACHTVWRSRAKYVDKLWARDAAKRREQAARTLHLRNLEFPTPSSGRAA